MWQGYWWLSLSAAIWVPPTEANVARGRQSGFWWCCAWIGSPCAALLGIEFFGIWTWKARAEPGDRAELLVLGEHFTKTKPKSALQVLGINNTPVQARNDRLCWRLSDASVKDLHLNPIEFTLCFKNYNVLYYIFFIIGSLSKIRLFEKKSKALILNK